MKNFLGKIFGGKKDENSNEALVGELLETLIEKANLDLSFDLSFDEEHNEVRVDLYGDDEELLLSKEGQLLDALQLFVKRVVQHRLPEERLSILLDSDNFREQADQSLIDLAEKLKSIAVSKDKPVYFRALPPRDRKVIHQYIAEDGRVKSRSIGDGLYKKIKIYPIKGDKEERNLEA